ncbi:uncharacterized protein An02g00720 [Aspergillus niger]|uniref:Contig An02c0010, genomic contig n=2 Tax=Aspergillus niger TaxID=5061 RepID=A2QBP0_ASPNC|nr:uncharacterized protein An02g00720 [Aspergillus niger]CAK96287.1 unnamed protein product [Aspergillus niger]
MCRPSMVEVSLGISHAQSKPGAVRGLLLGLPIFESFLAPRLREDAICASGTYNAAATAAAAAMRFSVRTVWKYGKPAESDECSRMIIGGCAAGPGDPSHILVQKALDDRGRAWLGGELGCRVQ